MYLRANVSLRSLNLSQNDISDEGGALPAHLTLTLTLNPQP